jgi:hypothetical protein
MVVAAYSPSLSVSLALSKADSQIDCSAYELKRALSGCRRERRDTTFAAAAERECEQIFAAPARSVVVCLPRRNFAMMASLCVSHVGNKAKRRRIKYRKTAQRSQFAEREREKKTKHTRSRLISATFEGNKMEKFKGFWARIETLGIGFSKAPNSLPIIIL